MNRRSFLETSAKVSIATGLGISASGTTISPTTTHILSFSFDDGFKQSFLTIADIFEAVGLSACFNVIASAHLPGFEAPDDYILPELVGEWETWQGLVKRGHEVMPHGWKHTWLNRLPLEEAKGLIKQSIDYFEENLTGFNRETAVFNFPFNASTPELEAYTLTQIGALRTRGPALNELPSDDLKILTCETFGPDTIDKWVKKKVNSFLNSPGGWMILNTHGVDGEGWGPLNSRFLSKLLTRLVKIPSLGILPVTHALFTHR